MRILVAICLAFGTAALGQTQDAPAPQGGAPPSAAADAGTPAVSDTTAVQIMLDRSGFSPGEIDGRAGPNLKRALQAFQRVHGLDSSGELNDATRRRLSERSGNVPPLVRYRLAEADVDGPFQPDIPQDLIKQAALKSLAYRNALEALAEKFHSSPRLLEELNPEVTFTTAGEHVLVPNVEPFEPPARERGNGAEARERARGTSGRGSGRPDRGATESASDSGAVTISVSRSASSLTIADASGRILFHAPVTSGSERDPLPIGEWKVTSVHPMPVFHYNPDLFWDADPAQSKAALPPGPNNPVGVAWIDLSKEHYGIHGTGEPSGVGHVQSHGCVRLTNWDVSRVMQWARPGTRVIFEE